MTSRERFVKALAGGIPDRVPVAPDTSNYIPAKHTGLPFWDIYHYRKVPLWRAYLDVMDYYGGDAWVGSCCGVPTINKNSRVEWHHEISFPDPDRAVVRHRVRTPDGELTGQHTIFRYDPPSPNEKLMKDLARDWPKYRWLLQPPTDLDRKAFDEIRDECHRRGHAFGLCVGYPGFQCFEGAIQGGVQTLTYALEDCPEILDEWCDLVSEQCVKSAQLGVEAGMEYLGLGGSGTITLASPSLAMRYAIPAIAKIAALADRAGIPTVLHSCGRSRVLVDLLVEHTRVTCINPLEIPPMGDVDLAEVKSKRGAQIALMGNLHTTQVMLQGTPDLVRQRSLEAMRNAGEGGGFILSTGDQCPRDTPEENLFAMIETAKRYGTYDAQGRLPLVEEALGCACGTA